MKKVKFNIIRLWVVILITIFGTTLNAQFIRRVVDIHAKKGSKKYSSIQDAINSLSDSSKERRIIFIKNGTYREKIFVTKNNIVFEGENREKTIITFDIARDEWRCDHNDDWGVATLNLNGNDLTFRNLTIANDYGFNNKNPRLVNCASDTTKHQKVITNGGHQMALRSIRSTRLQAINCRFRAYAGDTVSPWNLTDGMFYFKDCIIEGGVDFYCPRGWAFAEHCTFFANTGAASIWHDGTGNKDFKTILRNCSFDGFKGFNLGRYHKDAQFYLINCTFSSNMADKDIYLVPTANVLQWGRRIFYFNCHKTGGDYDWFKNNLENADGKPDAKNITVNWLFKNNWHPEEN